MKISKFLIITALSLPIFGFAQQTSEVPKKVTETFAKEFQVTSADVNPTWTIVNDRYIAKFTINSMKNEILYNAEGQQLESLVEISKERLQPSQIEFVKSTYSKAKIQTVYLQNSAVAPERIVIEIIQNGKTIRLYFRPDGTFFEEQKL